MARGPWMDAMVRDLIAPTSTHITTAVTHAGGEQPALPAQTLTAASSLTPKDDRRWPEPCPTKLARFIQGLQPPPIPQPPKPRWWKESALRRWGNRCVYCGAEQARSMVLSPLIPLFVGGPDRADGLAPCCRRCQRSKGTQDLLLWQPNVSQELLTLRQRLGVLSWNIGPKRMPRSLIAERWKHPRFRFEVTETDQGALLGWRGVMNVPIELQLRLMMEHGAWRMRSPAFNAHGRPSDLAVLWMPDRDRLLPVWEDLIAHNEVCSTRRTA